MSLTETSLAQGRERPSFSSKKSSKKTFEGLKGDLQGNFQKLFGNSSPLMMDTIMQWNIRRIKPSYQELLLVPI